MFSIDHISFLYHKYPVRMKHYVANIFAFVDYSFMRPNFCMQKSGFLCIPLVIDYCYLSVFS